MEIDYGKIALLMLFWLVARDVVPEIANGIIYALYEIIYYIIKGEHSLYYWRHENERLDRQLESMKARRQKSNEQDRTIGFHNDEIKS